MSKQRTIDAIDLYNKLNASNSKSVKGSISPGRSVKHKAIEL